MEGNPWNLSTLMSQPFFMWTLWTLFDRACERLIFLKLSNHICVFVCDSVISCTCNNLSFVLYFTWDVVLDNFTMTYELLNVHSASIFRCLIYNMQFMPVMIIVLISVTHVGYTVSPVCHSQTEMCTVTAYCTFCVHWFPGYITLVFILL